MGRQEDTVVDVQSLSPQAWRLLRTAADYEQRAVEKELDNLMQAHVSMLENNNRSLSVDRLEQLFELYTAELTQDQVRAIADNF
jgi:transcriptional regulator with XRE-family HTH domain